LVLLLPTLACGCSSSSGPDNYAPDISILTPLAGTTVSRGEIVDFDVSASDPDGAVIAVWLYADGRRVGVDSTSPYLFQWDTRGEDIGRRVLRATALDDGGQVSEDVIGVSVRWGDFAPEQLDDGWETSTAGAEGIDAERLAWMMDEIYAGGHEFMHALLVARNGKLVFEEYFGDFERNTLQHVQSTTKSFTSALVGIAIDRGEIGGVNDPMVDYLPEYAHLFDGDKVGITIQHCLMMAAGLEWNEISTPTLDSTNDNIMGHMVPDYVAFVLAKPLVQEPGTVWYYNSGCPLTMGAILRNATGMPADDYAEQHLFGPLGVAPVVWPSINNGRHVGTHGSLYVRGRDMAKFGQLFLRDGVWGGEQVISAEWVAESTQPRLTVWGYVRYGYQWWFEEMSGYDVPYTSGYGGQHIFIIPELDAVIVTAADYSNTDGLGEQTGRIMRLVEYWIVPALLPATSLAGLDGALLPGRHGEPAVPADELNPQLSLF
jgi:CubicO group peptidase (beta-lactamase class C family)